MKYFEDYLEASKDLIKQAFGEEIFNKLENTPLRSIVWNGIQVESNPAGPNINERFTDIWIDYSKEHGQSFLDIFIGIVIDYGFKQSIDYELEQILTYKKNKNKEKFNFSEYMNECKRLMKEMFNDIYEKIESIQLKSFKWKGLDISTSSILATSPGVKEKFNPGWVKYFRERDYLMIDSVLQSIFHYGYQYGVDTVVEPERQKFYTSVSKLKTFLDEKK